MELNQDRRKQTHILEGVPDTVIDRRHVRRFEQTWVQRREEIFRRVIQPKTEFLLHRVRR